MAAWGRQIGVPSCCAARAHTSRFGLTVLEVVRPGSMWRYIPRNLTYFWMDIGKPPSQLHDVAGVHFGVSETRRILGIHKLGPHQPRTHLANTMDQYVPPTSRPRPESPYQAPIRRACQDACESSFHVLFYQLPCMTPCNGLGRTTIAIRRPTHER